MSAAREQYHKGYGWNAVLAGLTGADEKYDPAAIEQVLNTSVSIVFVELARRNQYGKVLEFEQKQRQK